MNTTFMRVFALALLLTTLCLPAQENHDDFIVHVIPKCGTHFTHRIIELLTDVPMGLSPTSIQGIQQAEANKLPVRIFGPYDPLLEMYLKKKHIKILTVYRDPRDALISHLFYMRSFYQNNPQIGLKRDFFQVSARFDQLTFDEQLTLLITGADDMTSYLDFYISRIKWTFSDLALGLKYEELVGSQGGGSDKKRAAAITNLANYINFTLSQEKLDYILANMYVKKEDVEQEDKTFVRASIGNWNTFFNENHKKLFKKRAGKLLVQLGYEKNDKW